MINLRELQEYDPSKKTGKEGYIRAKKVVRYLRMCSKNIVDEKRAKENKDYLFGIQSLELIKKAYKDPENSGINWVQYAIMEKLRNVLIAEQEDGGINWRLHCTDVMAVNERDRDLALMKNRGWIEPMQTGVNKMMGLPGYSMMNDKKLFNGNVEEFDKMGLDYSNAEDLNYFWAQHYRLRHEIYGEAPMNYFIKYNELDEIIPAWYNDILAVKCCASRTYVSETSGAIDIKYLAPENVKAIAGRRRDYKDASSVSYEDVMSTGDFIKLIGNEFDFENDIAELLRAVNATNSTNYTGILNGSQLYYGNQNGHTIQFSDFIIFKIKVGYIEWKEWNGVTHNIYQSRITGRRNIRSVNYYTPEKPNSQYERDCRYYESTYKAYYLACGDFEVPLYKYGLLSHQVIEGVEDEISNFSISISQEYGKSAIDVAKPYIDDYEAAMKKLKYMIVRAKPPGRMWSFESLLTMAKSVFPGIPVERALNNLMAQFKGMSDEMYAIPTVNGNPVGGGGAQNFDLPHGLSKSVMEFKELALFYESQMWDKIGISPLRMAYQPGEKDGLGLQEQATAYSEKATAYMPRMLSRLVKNIAIRTLSYTQDIIEFAEKQSLPYKFLTQALGDNMMVELSELKKVSLHRYNIFVEGLGTMQSKRDAKMMAQQALVKGDIDYAQWLLIDSIDNPKLAVMTLSYEKNRKERVAAQQQAAVAQQQSAFEDKRHTNKMGEIQLEGDLGIKRESERGFWYAKGQEISVKGAMDKQNAKIEAEPELIKAKEDAANNKTIANAVADKVQPTASVPA